MNVYKSAEISPCGRYRWRLDRWWGDGRGRVGFLMLNPSTADADLDDATIRKCIGFAQLWGHSGITVVNLYALRSRDPQELVRQHKAGVDAAGDRNLGIIAAVGRDVDEWVCAWGCESTTRQIDTHHQYARQCVNFFCPTIPERPVQLGPATKTGSPRHPLMAPYASPLIPFGVTR